MSQPPYPPQPHQPQAGPWQQTPPPPDPWQSGSPYGQPAPPGAYPQAPAAPSAYGPPGAAPYPPQPPQPTAPYQQQPYGTAPNPYATAPNPYAPAQQPYGPHSAPHPYPPAAPAQPRRSRTGKILLVVLPLVLLLCVGGGTAAFLTLTGDSEGTTPHGPSADGTTAPPDNGSKTTPPVPPGGVRLVMPPEIGSRPKLTDDLQKLALEFAGDLKKGVPGATTPAGAAYGNRTTKDVTIIWAASGSIADPDQALTEAYDALQGGQKLDIASEPVDPGPLGGRASCATVRDTEKSSVVCAWADRGSVGMMMNLKIDLDQMKSEFVAIRGAVEQRR